VDLLRLLPAAIVLSYLPSGLWILLCRARGTEIKRWEYFAPLGIFPLGALLAVGIFGGRGEMGASAVIPYYFLLPFLGCQYGQALENAGPRWVIEIAGDGAREDHD